MWIHMSINIDDNIKEPIPSYKICNIGQIMVFGGYAKVRGFVYTQVVTQINIHSKAYWYQDNFV